MREQFMSDRSNDEAMKAAKEMPFIIEKKKNCRLEE